MRDLFQGLKGQIDFDVDARERYETRVVSKSRVLDIGGRNSSSRSRRRIALLSRNPHSTIVSSDIVEEYRPDIVDDICHTKIEPNSFDGVYCDAILEHVTEYWRALDNIYDILEEKGEAFLYVPFVYAFHDLMDYHRFTFTEVSRMLRRFSDVRLFMPGKSSGFGFVYWYILSFGTIMRFPAIHRMLAEATNRLLSLALLGLYRLKRRTITREHGNVSFDEFRFYYVYLRLNHGFCAWVRK
jgi:hypothetical protein